MLSVSAEGASSSSEASYLELLRLSAEAGMAVAGVSFQGDWCGGDQLTCRKMVALARLLFAAGRAAGHDRMDTIDVGTPNLDQPEFEKVRTAWLITHFRVMPQLQVKTTFCVVTCIV